MTTNMASYDNQGVGFTLKLNSMIKNTPLIGPYAKPIWIAAKQQLIFKPKKLLSMIAHGFKIFSLVSKFYILLYIKRVEHYQPLYNFGIFVNENAQRICLDRADAIYNEIKAQGPGAQILDIGCSLGYFAHYFAERNYFVDGIDSNVNNIAVCKLLQYVNKKNTQFSVAAFSSEFVEHLSSSKYDIAFIFSVMHHITYYKGLEYAQNLMAQLVEKIPALFVELAVKQEETNSPWIESLPENELEIFAKCKNITIQKIGYFKNHLSTLLRPLYVVRKKTQQIGDNFYTVQNKKSTSYSDSQYNGCHYYDCGDLYIKKYLHSHCKDRMKNILQEIENHKKLPQTDLIPTLKTYEQSNELTTLVFKKIPGENLRDLLTKGYNVPALSVFNKLITTLEFLLQHGLYHNDIRLWNIMFDGNESYLIDLELANAQEIENTNISLLWIIAQLHNFMPRNFIYPITDAPDFSSIQLQAVFHPIVNALQSTHSFSSFLNWFKQYTRNLQ